MNKLFAIGLLLISILAAGASAASVTLSTDSLSAENRPTETFSMSFTVSNASTNLSNIALAQSGLSDFNLNFSINNVPVTAFSLNVGESKTITVNGKVPENINTRVGSYSGTITLSATDLARTLAVTIKTPSQLDLKSVKFIVDGSSRIINNGEIRKDVKPGSKLEINGDVRNLFTDDPDQDITIENVNVEITIENIDDGDDISDDYDVGDIDAEEKENFKIKFEIPEDVDESEYHVDILVEGEDSNGAKHAVEWKNVKVKVEKDKDDVWIVKSVLSPSTVSCTRNANLDVKLKNQGTSNEDEVVLSIESSALGIDIDDTTIPELDEGTGDDTEYSKTYSFKVDDKVSAGAYPITLRVYYDTDTLSQTKAVDLAVAKCVAEEKEEAAEVIVTPPVTTAEPEEEETPEIITSPVTETTETSFLQSNTYLIFLAAAIGVAVIVIIIMIVVLFTLRRRE